MNAAARPYPPRVIVIGVLVPALVAAIVAITGVNRALFGVVYHALHVVPAPLYAPLWESATYAGDGLAAIALAALLLRWRADVAIAAFVATIPLVGLFTHGIRAFVSVDRPPLVLSSHDLTVLGPVLQHGSFPSGHSATAAALAGVLVLAIRHPGWRALFVLGAGLIALSRIAVGVHWPVDVCAGFAGGWLAAWIAWVIAVNREWTRQRAVRIIACAVCASCSIYAMFHSMGLPDAAGFRIALALIGFVASMAALLPLLKPAAEARAT